MKRILFTLIALISLIFAEAQTLSDSSRIYLLTCTPGRPLYLHFGHSAIRVEDPAFRMPDSLTANIDWTFNYGIFSFDTEHFYWRFVQGKTDYQLGLQHTHSFMIGSAEEGRDVYSQELQLSLPERQHLFDALLENYRPENRIYRYNFVFDNCATRPLHLIANTLPSFVVPDSLTTETWREAITYYAGRYSWGEFGINLCFGRQADHPMTLRESLFLPERLMYFLQNYQINAAPLVTKSQIAPFVPRDSEFRYSPYFFLIILLMLMIALTTGEVVGCTRTHFGFFFDAVLFCIYFIVGVILTFLIFFSTHPFVQQNINYLFFNPLWIFPLCFSFTANGRRRLSNITFAMTVYSITALVLTVVSGQTFHLALLLPITHILRLIAVRHITPNITE